MEQALQQAPKLPKEKKTIYDVGYASIFVRNFLVGFARGLGTITVYVFLGGIIYYLAVTYIIPQVKSIIPDISPLLGPTVQQSPDSADGQGGYTITPEQLKTGLELLQQGGSQTP